VDVALLTQQTALAMADSKDFAASATRGSVEHRRRRPASRIDEVGVLCRATSPVQWKTLPARRMLASRIRAGTLRPIHLEH
jgi:hypothetical protein